MIFKTRSKAKSIQVTTTEEFLRLSKRANLNKPVVFNGFSSSGGSLFLMSNGTQFTYTWRDRGGIKEGWMSNVVKFSERGAARKIKELMRY